MTEEYFNDINDFDKDLIFNKLRFVCGIEDLIDSITLIACDNENI